MMTGFFMGNLFAKAPILLSEDCLLSLRKKECLQSQRYYCRH
jgi:hypothetical protein